MLMNIRILVCYSYTRIIRILPPGLVLTEPFEPISPLLPSTLACKTLKSPAKASLRAEPDTELKINSVAFPINAQKWKISKLCTISLAPESNCHRAAQPVRSCNDPLRIIDRERVGPFCRMNFNLRDVMIRDPRKVGYTLHPQKSHFPLWGLTQFLF